MATWVWIVIIAAIVLAVLVIAYVASASRRRRGLQDRFGPEYDRTVESADSRRKAESDLRQREQRHDELDIRELSPAARDRYAEQWRTVQTRFVDAPGDAVREADSLVQHVMRDRGYPVDDFDTRADAVSVDHPHLVENYRAAHGVWAKNERGQASTEDLRQSLVHYRSLFEELLGRGAADEPISRDETTADRAAEPRSDGPAGVQAERQEQTRA